MSKKKISSKLDQVPEIIQIRQKPQNDLQIENLVLQDMRKKILNDEMNSLQFYDIVQPDQDEMIKTLKETTKTPVKLHKKVKRSDLENRLRAKLAEEPGSKLLLQEIYEKLEEDENKREGVSKKMHQEEQFKANQQYKAESDDQLVANLDVWYKATRKRQKEEQEKIRLEQEKERQQQEKESKEMIYIIEEQAKLQMQQRTQSISNFRRAGLAVKDQRHGTSIIPAFPKLMQQNLSEEKINVDGVPGQTKIRQRLMGTLSLLTVRRKVELLNQDSNLTKQLDKYMQQGSTLTQQELQQIDIARAKQEIGEQNGTLIFDYTVEGLKNSLHTLIKMQLVSFQNAIDRAYFYERQTNQILQQIHRKLEKQKQTVIKNEKDLEELRMENHEIHQKLRGIQNIIKELAEELKNVNSSPKEKLPKPQQSLSNFNPKSNSSHIDNYMSIVGKQNEIEDQIELMRDSYIKFQEQMKLNSKQIEKLEAENSKLNKNNKALLKSIQGFLLELLHIGLDCRKQGLCWIVKAVWDSGEKIADQNFPPYLDSKAKDFIMLKTRKIIELNDLFKKAHHLFSNYQGKDASIDAGNSSLITLLAKNHFSQIDSLEIKKQHIKERRVRSREEIGLLLNGLSEQEKKCIDSTITHIFSSKETLNDIVYTEATKRINKMFKSQQDFFNSQPQQSTIEQSMTSDIIFDNKDKLIKEYQQIQQDIELKEIQFKKFEDLELSRIVKEIEYRKYLQRFNIEALQVLSALFGYHKAERELIKFGMMHKMLKN